MRGKKTSTMRKLKQIEIIIVEHKYNFVLRLCFKYYFKCYFLKLFLTISFDVSSRLAFLYKLHL